VLPLPTAESSPARGNGAYGHQIDHRNHRDDAGKKASSPQNKLRPRSGLRGVRAMAGGGGLAGVTQTGTMGHGSMNREHREREETKANSTRCISRPEKARCGTRYGRSWRGSSELADTALEATIRENEGMGRKRGARQSSPSGKTESRWLRDDC
jgi:hypothetical protein